MHRLGFQEEEIEMLVPLLRREEFQIISLFTHLAASEDSTMMSLHRQQIRVFNHMASYLSDQLGVSISKAYFEFSRD